MAAGALGVGTVLALLPAAGHDQLWCLYVAGRMLDGVRLYGPQIFESNPPLIMWLSEAPVALARVLHVESSSTAKFLTCIALLAVYSFTLSCLRLQKEKRLQNRLDAAVLAFFFAVAYLCVPARDFGQREHLLSFLVLPYLVLAAAPRAGSSQLRIVAGAMAAVGICLKPQQALVPLAMELLLVVRSRSLRPLRRPEPWLLLSICVLYVGAICLVTPEYVSQTLPILRQTYWAIGHLTPFALLRESWQLQVLACFSCALLWMPQVRRNLAPPDVTLAYVLLAAGVGAEFAYLQQGTGWYYQQLPAIVCFLAATMSVAVRTLSLPINTRRWRTAWIHTAAIALSLSATLLTLHFSGYPLTRDRAFAITSPDPALFRDLPAHTPVAILTTSVDEAMMPVARYHLLWAQRTNNLWWMPAILRSEASSGNTRIDAPHLQLLAALQRRNVAEDLDRWQPALVLIERCHDPAVRCQVMEDLSPNLLAWFAKEDVFRHVFASYRFERTDGRFDVYVRQPAF